MYPDAEELCTVLYLDFGAMVVTAKEVGKI